MKKLLLPLLAATLLICALAGCSNNNAASTSSSSSSTSSSHTESSSVSSSASPSSSVSHTENPSEKASVSSKPSTPEDAVKDVIDTEFQDLFGYDRYAEGISRNPDTKKTFDELGINVEDYCRTAAGLYSYEISNITITDNQAEVTMQFKGPELGNAFEEKITNKIKEMAGVDNLDTLPNEEALKLETKAIYDILKNNELPVLTHDVKQFYVRSPEGEWVIDMEHEGNVSFTDLI